MADAENSDYVVIDRVTKRFGEEMVLKETTMTMKRGKVYGIVGNNGSGKTVLMKCICGFLPVTSGSICVGQKYIGRDTDFPESLGLIIETPGFLKYKGERYAAVIGRAGNGDEICEVVYMENIQDLYRAQNRRLFSFLATGLLLEAVIGTMLYMTMKKIYMPVNNIAHELRNPLTVLQGYGQYIQMGNITEEDRFFAGEQIVKEAGSLRETVDRLLVMGNLREGNVKYQRLDVQELFAEMKKLYPGIHVENHMDAIEGDLSLVRCLFKNLLGNAVKAGSHVTVTASDNCVSIWNDGKYIEKQKLNYLNRNHEFPRAKAERNGYGIGLCYEIVKLHGWKMDYASSEEKGTTVKIRI